MPKQLSTVIPVWGAVLVGAVLTGLLVPSAYYLFWLSIVFACAILLTFCVQLAIVRKEGLVDRVVLTLCGSILILAVATLVLGLVAVAER